MRENREYLRVRARKPGNTTEAVRVFREATTGSLNLSLLYPCFALAVHPLVPLVINSTSPDRLEPSVWMKEDGKSAHYAKKCGCCAKVAPETALGVRLRYRYDAWRSSAGKQKCCTVSLQLLWVFVAAHLNVRRGGSVKSLHNNSNDEGDALLLLAPARRTDDTNTANSCFFGPKYRRV